MTFCDLTIYNDNPLLIRLCNELDLLPNFEWFSIEHLRRVWHADRGRLLPPDTWSYPIWDLQLFIKTQSTLPTCDAYRIRHIYRNLHYRIREVSTEYMQRVWHASRGRWLLRTPGPVPLGLAYVLLVETNPFRTCRYFTGLWSSNIPRYFLDLALFSIYTLHTIHSSCSIVWSKSTVKVLTICEYLSR